MSVLPLWRPFKEIQRKHGEDGRKKERKNGQSEEEESMILISLREAHFRVVPLMLLKQFSLLPWYLFAGL